MKIRNLIFASAFTVAIVSSFAFKVEKKFTKNATYHPHVLPLTCGSSITDDDCYRWGTGAQCTAYDPYSQTYELAFDTSQDAQKCVYPLYHEF